MSSYKPLLRTSFVLGPTLLLISALSFALGIGLIPPGKTSYIEGMFGAYALIFFVPIYLYLGYRLREAGSKLGTVGMVTGLMGAVVGCSLELMRTIEHGLRQVGVGDAVWNSYYATPNTEFLAVAYLGPLFPITSLILGYGIFRTRLYPRWVAASMMIAGIFFPLAQVLELDWALMITYPAACVLWFVVYTYLGTRKAFV